MSDHFHTDIQPCDRPSCAYDLLPLTSIGFPEDVNQEILNLHHCGYDVDVWSPPQRILGSAEVITVWALLNRNMIH